MKCGLENAINVDKVFVIIINIKLIFYGANSMPAVNW